jgi:hypothetical protein
MARADAEWEVVDRQDIGNGGHLTTPQLTSNGRSIEAAPDLPGGSDSFARTRRRVARTRV